MSGIAADSSQQFRGPAAWASRNSERIICDQIVASVTDAGAGPSYSVVALSDALADHGVSVSLHTVDKWRGQNTAGTPRPKVTLHCYARDNGPWGALTCASRGLCRALIKSAKVNHILHAHGLWLMPNVYPAWAVSRSGARSRLVVSPRGMLGPAALRFSHWKKIAFWHLLQRRAVEAAACLHATSDAELADIRSFGVTSPVAVIPNGIDLPALSGRALPETPFLRTVLSLGRIHPKKGLDFLVRAWAQVEKSFPEWQLRIVGPAEHNHDIELKILATSLMARRVTIEGPVFADDKLSAYYDADVFVLSTLNENFAMTVAEALAAGTPVISTTGAPWSGLEVEKCGWWVEPGVTSLAAALGNAMAMPPDVLKAMGARGRAWMEREFSWDTIALKMIDLYWWLVSDERKPDFVHLD